MSYIGSSGGASYMTGMAELTAAMNAEIIAMRTASLSGLVKASIFMRNVTEHVSPKTPMRLGNLVASWFVVTANAIHKGEDAVFTGPDSAKFTGDHTAAIAEKRAEAFSLSGRDRQILVMGYSASYAGFLHEALNITHFTREGSGVKWFETHFKANKDQILNIIRTNISTTL